LYASPRAFVDIVDRIDAFFIGPPTERQVWEQTIIDATHVMQRVGRDLDRQGIKGDILRGGFQYAAEGVEVSFSLLRVINTYLILCTAPAKLSQH
jgi:hypothetical protein